MNQRIYVPCSRDTHTRLTALRDSERSESSITDIHSCHHVSP